jgi:hypothetical protein
MDLTNDNIQRNSSRRFDLRYVATFAGLALAVSGVVVMGDWRTNSHQPVSPQQATMSRSPAKTSILDFYLYYLVDSEERRDALMETAMGQLYARTWIFVVKSLEDELAWVKTQAELTNRGQDVRVIDLRGR